MLIDGAYGEIDEQSISDSEQLKKFLIDQSENKMLVSQNLFFLLFH